ncbi:MAG: HPr kinase/phosphatase C-terminal domain-containing protein [Rhizobiales bacterium]|nr:HPr kinase/phosphatase C-terminal domain-containing protein [Hyphomicrobiales bacterium]
MPSIHATAVLVGSRAVLIRGPAGSGKSALALALLRERPFARLIADDRVIVSNASGRLVAAAPAATAGLIEVRGVGIIPVPYEPAGVVGWVVDLAAADAERLPPDEACTTIMDVTVRRIAVAGGVPPLPMLLAVIGATE